ncbi:hypothetical protein ACFTQL_20370 [Peribacillus butanolivorans]|uniref:hypothetical protein n=1 Tax=Peribacillus butanolivorans TaxID=421767 RepID=UPI00362AF6FE
MRKSENIFLKILANNNVSMEMEPLERQINYVKPDDDYDFHTYRILLLINVCGHDKTSVSNKPVLYGRRKFAFFDFLIRYPFYLQKVIEISNKVDLESKLQLSEHEKIEAFSPMIHYLRGPWDKRYDQIFSYMVSKNLVDIKFTNVTPKGKKQFCILLTDLGLDISEEIKTMEILWKERMEIINAIFPKKTTNERIDTYIFTHFPELILGGGKDVY